MARFLPTASLALMLLSSSALAEPVTPDRFGALPPAEQSAWKTYLDRSRANALADQAAIQAEVVANKLPGARRAPSGGDYKLKQKPGDPWFAGDEAKTLADAILSYQTPSGGWSKHLGFTRGPRQPGMQWTSQNEPGEPAHYVATFDNGSTTREMDLLAGVWLATKREDCKAGFIKGLGFILAAQFPNGGWPQVYPLEGAYHDDITFNDDAMTNVLELLQRIAANEPGYAFLDDAQRKRAADALALGTRCVLQTQIAVNGKKTVWCTQYDSLTLQAAGARKMEPATLSGLESAHILKFLMTFTQPTPEIVASIESGLAWFEQAKTTRAVHAQSVPETEDDDAGAAGASGSSKASGTSATWARFYDLKTGKPVFPGRDGVQYDSFEAMAAKNKIGYDYYTSRPNSIVTTGQKKWRKMLVGKAGKAGK